MSDAIVSLIGPISGSQLALVAIGVFAAGFLRGFVGFGGALVIILILSAVFGPLTAVPVAAVSGLPTTLQLLPSAIRDADRSFVLPFGLATFAAAPLGTLVLVSLDPAVMKIAISLFVLAMVAMLHTGWRPAVAVGRTAAVGFGAAAGLVQGSAGVGGPPAVAIALARSGTPRQQRANVIGAVTSLAVCSLVPLWYHGLFTREVMILGLLLIPLYVFSTWLGTRFFTERGQRHFRNAALLALAVIGIVTLGLAVRGYLGR